MMATEKSQTYDTFDPVFDGTLEAPIDTEYTLPDYCPDIQKILKCETSPELSSYQITDGILTCEGVCEVRLLYLDAKGSELRTCDFRKEFTATTQVKSTAEKAVAWVEPAVSHMTCRASSARRIDLHLSVSLKALAVVQRQEVIPISFETDGVEQKTEDCPATQAVNAITHRFTVEDTLALKNGKPPIETILRKEVYCRVTDRRMADGMMTVSGNVELTFLYLSAVDGVTVEKFTSSTEFTQSVECNGAADDCLVDFRALAGECTVQPKEDDMGEHTAVSIVCKVFLAAFLYQPCQLQAVTDAYGTAAPLSLHTTQLSLLQADSIHTETMKKKLTLSVQEEEMEKVIDLWCEQGSVQTVCEKGRLSFRVQGKACLLYQAAGGKLCFVERPIDYNSETELSHAQSRKTTTVSHTELWEYRIADKTTVELTVETNVAVFLYSRTQMSYVSSAAVTDDATAYPPDPRFAVYYATQGESLWEIAKAHCTSLSSLREQNELYEDTVPDSRPLILCCQS